MENKIFRKSISVDRVFYGLDPEIGLHFYFHYKPFPGLKRAKREIKREKEEITSLTHSLTHTDPLPHGSPITELTHSRWAQPLDPFPHGSPIIELHPFFIECQTQTHSEFFVSSWFIP